MKVTTRTSADAIFDKRNMANMLLIATTCSAMALLGCGPELDDLRWRSSAIEGEQAPMPGGAYPGNPPPLHVPPEPPDLSQPADPSLPADQPPTCTAVATTDATCDGIDDDCNGQVDEDVEGIALKLTSFTMGSGAPGGGFDLDHDVGTCSPTPCTGGIDSGLSIVANMLNPLILAGLDAGAWVPLLDVTNLSADGTTSEVAWHDGQLDPSSLNCDLQTQTCAFKVSSSVCSPTAAFSDARIDEGVFTAGSTAPPTIQIRLGGGIPPVDLHGARLKASVTTSGGAAVSISGLLGGAVLQADLFAAIRAAPPALDSMLPLPREAVIGMLQLLVSVDIDTDGDGMADAYSAGFTFGGKAASITGVAASQP